MMVRIVAAAAGFLALGLFAAPAGAGDSSGWHGTAGGWHGGAHRHPRVGRSRGGYAFLGHTGNAPRTRHGEHREADLVVVERPEPYIGRGLIYNVPTAHAGHGRRHAIRARY